MIPPPREIPEGAPRLAGGRYVLLARIGRGGMAGVYAAWDLEIEEWRAIKVLLPKHARDGGLRMRFEREGLTMKSLQHPNLVRVYGVGSGEKLPFLVMELINAGSLYRWTKTHGAMPPRMATEAMIQLCSGVSAVHAAGVVHRDIKPRNVLINWDGVLKLTDFGIAQLGGSQETRTGLAMGTLGFMSPEQLHDAKSVDLRTDIYAIGATLWSQITGRKARDLFRMEEEPRMMDGIPEPLRPVLSRCLSYERADRYPSARALSDALSDLLIELPEDPPDTPPLPLGGATPSFRSKPESMFSEILTTLDGEPHSHESGGSVESAESSGPAAPPRGRDEARTLDPDRLDGSLATPTAPPMPLPASGLRTPPPSLIRDAFTRNAPPASPPGARWERWSDQDDPASLPSYMIGVEQPADTRRPEIITYRPDVEAPPPVSPLMVWARRLAIATIVVPLGGMLALLVTVTLVASVGAWRVRAATTEVSSARIELSERLAREEALPRELELLGADGDRIRDAYRRWDRTPAEPARTSAALAYIHLVEEEARARVSLTHRTHEEEIVRQRVDRLIATRTEVLAAAESLDRAAGSFPGRLSILLRLAPAPVLGPAGGGTVAGRP